MLPGFPGSAEESQQDPENDRADYEDDDDQQDYGEEAHRAIVRSTLLHDGVDDPFRHVDHQFADSRAATVELASRDPLLAIL